jgi:hypothetical protein
MPRYPTPNDTTRLVKRLRGGDQSARCALVSHVQARLVHLSSKVLRGLPMCAGGRNRATFPGTTRPGSTGPCPP